MRQNVDRTVRVMEKMCIILEQLTDQVRDKNQFKTF